MGMSCTLAWPGAEQSSRGLLSQGFAWARFFAKGGGKMDDCTGQSVAGACCNGQSLWQHGHGHAPHLYRYRIRYTQPAIPHTTPHVICCLLLPAVIVAFVAPGSTASS